MCNDAMHLKRLNSWLSQLFFKLEFAIQIHFFSYNTYDVIKFYKIKVLLTDSENGIKINSL